jgi:hypothetical protein
MGIERHLLTEDIGSVLEDKSYFHLKKYEYFYGFFIGMDVGMGRVGCFDRSGIMFFSLHVCLYVLALADISIVFQS